MSNEDKGPSPADGPAKVFGREWTFAPGHPAIEEEDCGIIDTWRIDLGPLSVVSDDNGTWWTEENHNEASEGLPIFLRDLLSALLSLIPPEQVVQAMGGETRGAIVGALARRAFPGWDQSDGVTVEMGLSFVERIEEQQRLASEADANWSRVAEGLIRERDEALARAEKAEEHRLNVAQALGITYEADGHAVEPGPDDAVIGEILGLKQRLEKAEENYRFMVERAADEKLDGYRELGQRAADAENARDSEKSRADQAERERDEARSELDRCKAFCRERIQEIHQWERWADLSPRGINVDAPPSNAMHAAAEELRAQAAVLPEAHSGRTSRCRLCHGVGWAQLFGEPRKPCKVCNGTGRKTEESDGLVQRTHYRPKDWKLAMCGARNLSLKATDDARKVTCKKCLASPNLLRAQTGPEPAHRRDDPALPDGEGRGLPTGVHLAEQDTAGEADRGASKDPVKPLGIPASATIWAKVVDGLGRKVGAWFEAHGAYQSKPCVKMDNPGTCAQWTWCPALVGNWQGTLDPALTPSAAAQCRQLYEKGLAHLAAEATHQALAEDLEDFKPPKQPGQTPERYRPKTDVQKLGKLVEECGEVLAAAGKTMRWGLDSTNPELPPEQQETNAAWLARELCDLEEAIGFAREVLAAHEGGAP